jgi:hypothetical protein
MKFGVTSDEGSINILKEHSGIMAVAFFTFIL